MAYEDEYGQDSSNAAPVQRFRINFLEAAVWENHVDTGRVFYNVTITRSFQDRTTGDWRSTTSYSHGDLLNVARLAERAESWIANKQSGRQPRQQAPAPQNGGAGASPSNEQMQQNMAAKERMLQRPELATPPPLSADQHEDIPF